jgi:hypothetical protein
LTKDIEDVESIQQLMTGSDQFGLTHLIFLVVIIVISFHVTFRQIKHENVVEMVI